MTANKLELVSKYSLQYMYAAEVLFVDIYNKRNLRITSRCIIFLSDRILCDTVKSLSLRLFTNNLEVIESETQRTYVTGIFIFLKKNVFVL